MRSCRRRTSRCWARHCGDHGLCGRGPVSQSPAQPAQVALGRRHEVGAPQPEQLDAVLEGAQQPVGRAERRGVLAPDVAPGGQRGQPVERGAGAQRLVGAAVHELEQLHRELDVAQPAGAELELAVGLGRRGCAARPAGASPARRRRSCSRLDGLPHHRLHGVAVAPARPRGRRRRDAALSSAWNSQVLAQRS